MKVKICLIYAFLTFLYSHNSFAQNITLSNAKDNIPIEITAQGSFEFNQKDKTININKKAKVIKGDLVLNADKITAYYVGDKVIKKLKAKGNVSILTPKEKIYGDTIIFYLLEEKVEVKGSPAKLLYSDTELTSGNGMVFYQKQNKAEAYKAKITEKSTGRNLKADKLTANFKKTGSASVLDNIKATGGIIIENEKEIIKGNSAIYDVSKSEAELTGNVSIEQGETKLTGGKIIVDFKTGVTKILPINSGSDKVNAVIKK